MTASSDGPPVALFPAVPAVNDGLTRSSIVLAEDNPELRELLAQGLERVGFAVRQVANGLELFKEVYRITVDTERTSELVLIVSDVRMPEMDGITAVRMLRDRGVRTPVIFMTAYSDARTRGATEHLHSRWLEKPVGLTALRETIAEVLGLSPLLPITQAS